MHAYSLLCADRSHFQESTEGFTYVKSKHHELVARRIIPLIRGPLGDIQKWGLKIRRNVKKIKTRDGNTIDALDLDFLLAEMLEAFRE